MEGVNFVFGGGIVPDDSVIELPSARPGEDEPELEGWKFVSPDQLSNYCRPYQQRRISEALKALADPTQRGCRVEGCVA